MLGASKGTHCRGASASEAKIPTIVISTQLIEAGIDIDLPIVYRAMSGLDSIVQAGGRCNREGKRPTPGEVYVFSLSDGGKAFGAIAHGQNATRFLLDNDKEHTRPSIPLELIEAYTTATTPLLRALTPRILPRAYMMRKKLSAGDLTSSKPLKTSSS